MKNLYSLATLSFITDFQFFSTSKWSLSKKIEFLYKKYLLLILYLSRIKKFELGNSSINLFRNKIFLASASGLTPYQSIVTHHQKMLKSINFNKKPVIIDIGANVGFFSLFINDFLPQATIYAFEPIPLIFNTLKNNLNEYKNIHLFKEAVSDTDGTSTMMLYEDDPQHSMLIDNEKRSSKENTTLVKTIKLDSFIKKNDIATIDLLKIDVETFEKQVLKGAFNALSTTKCLLIEISVENNENYTFSELVNLLYSKDHNFQLVSFRSYDIGQDNKFLLGDFLFKNIALSR